MTRAEVLGKGHAAELRWERTRSDSGEGLRQSSGSNLQSDSGEDRQALISACEAGVCKHAQHTS
eukprot:4767955-Alexandrium_andersonii.AAC.1